LAWFDGFNGAHPNAPLTQGADGYFYGSTSAGGANGQGVLFRLGAASPSVLGLARSAKGNFTFDWSSMAGRSYQVQYSTSLLPGSWQNLGGPVVATNAPMTTTDLAPGDQKRYYRVVLLP